MAEYEKKVREKLAEYGCYFLRHGKGDHDRWQTLGLAGKVLFTVYTEQGELPHIFSTSYSA
jgi:hypothetical protein